MLTVHISTTRLQHSEQSEKRLGEDELEDAALQPATFHIHLVISLIIGQITELYPQLFCSGLVICLIIVSKQKPEFIFVGVRARAWAILKSNSLNAVVKWE